MYLELEMLILFICMGILRNFLGVSELPSVLSFKQEY